MAKEVKKCTIVSGAPDDNLEFIKNHINTDSYIIAADSGYKKLEAIGIHPDYIIGDFDSSQKPDDFNGLQLEVEKAYTDTFSAVRYAVAEKYSEIVIFGAIGNRIDHTYSNILCLDYCAKNGVMCMLMNDKNRISLIQKKGIVPRDYQWFSLFAYLEDCKGVRISGAHYSQSFYGLEYLNISRGDQFAQSNYVEDDFAEITVDEGTLLLIESND